MKYLTIVQSKMLPTSNKIIEINNPTQEVLDFYNSFMKVPLSIHISYVSGLIESEGVGGRVSFGDFADIKIDASLGIFDVAYVLAHELSHVCDIYHNNMAGWHSIKANFKDHGESFKMLFKKFKENCYCLNEKNISLMLLETEKDHVD